MSRTENSRGFDRNFKARVLQESVLALNMNKDTGGFCTGVSYADAAFSLDDCLAAYNAILSDCKWPLS